MQIVNVFRKRSTRVSLVAGLIFVFAALIDLTRKPENQFSATVYIGLVRVYQAVGRPLLEGTIACRFRPTCSDYSIEAVRRHGTIHGIVLTHYRLDSCAMNVPMGTIDEVPE